MSETESEAATKVRLQPNGDLTITENGEKTILAHYDKKTGELQFATKAFSENSDLRNQIVSRITTISKGTLPSGKTIKRFTIAGETAPIDKDAPPQPDPDNYPEGDANAEVVQWFLDHDIESAKVRYGLFCDAKGNPIKKPVKRIVVSIVDMRDYEKSDWAVAKQGNSETKGPIMPEGEEIRLPSAYIARRATALTFTPNEVVGGFKPSSDYRAPVNIIAED